MFDNESDSAPSRLYRAETSFEQGRVYEKVHLLSEGDQVYENKQKWAK